MMRILQVNTFDVGGGAETVASRLHTTYRQAGAQARLAVKKKLGDDPDVFTIPEADAFLTAATAIGSLGLPGCGLLGQVLRDAARPGAWRNRSRGVEDFDFPSTATLAGHSDILQCHNLHGNYFDLGALPALSRALPVVLTLHDSWMLGGHCAHSFDCERWKTGCGECPDLCIYPAVKSDATAYNWRRKQEIYADSRFYVATPSHWLMERVEQSMMMPGIVERRVIGNGIDDCFFQEPASGDVRRSLGISDNAKVLLFTANTIRENEWKDYKTLRNAVERIADMLGDREVVLIALGDDGPEEKIGGARLCFVPFRRDPAEVAAYYHAADVYLHAARVETFALTIAEAMACGTPVVAAAVGAVPERIDGTTGILVKPDDGEAMAAAAVRLLTDGDLCRNLGAEAERQARCFYRAETQAQAYLDWFREMLESGNRR